MNGLSLFSGIGGIDIALAPWVTPVAYCEINPYCQAVLLSRMADGRLHEAPIWPDVRTLPTEEIPEVDIISGGFPCQDISVAGLGKGLAGERSGLVFEILRLAQQIRPTFLFLENVPAIRTRGAYRIGKELAALRYDCRWGVISAYDVGAPFVGERWFLLAKTDSERRAHNQRRRATAWPTGREESDSSGEGSISRSQWLHQPEIPLVVDGISPGLVRLGRAIGNAVVPLQAREAFKRLAGIAEQVPR